MFNPLLTELQAALNKTYGGNVLNIEDDRKYDEYFCKDCRKRVYEDLYNHKQGICYSCWYKE